MSRKKSTLIRLVNSLKYEKRLILFATSFSILNKIFDLAPPVLIGIAVDVVVKEETSWLASFGFKSVPNQLYILAIFSFLIWTAESIFEYLYGLVWRNLAQKAQHKLRIDAYKHLQNLDMSFFEEDNTGRLLTILNDDINQLERFLDHGANQILQLLTTVLIVGAAMFALAPTVAFLAFIPIPLILWGSIKFQKLLTPKYRRVRKKAGQIASRLSNNLSGMLTIKSFATEEWEIEKLEKDSNQYKMSNNDAIRISAGFIPLIRFAILFAFVAILLLGGFQAWQGSIEIGAYSFLIFITQRLLWPLTTLGQTLDAYQRSMASVDRVLNLIDTPINIKSGIKKIRKEKLKGEIQFKNICFKYQDRDLLLQDFSLHIPANTTIGIVGPTGSGKSTLIKLLLRLYQINSGEILIDNIPIESLDLKSLRKSIALVSQEVYLFDGTVEENIAYGKPQASSEEIQQASVLSEAYEFIINLPNGFNTIVGERGQKLSGGQRQRIALARAILKESPILILDEATAAVDNETEAAIQRSLMKIGKEKTTLVIAHRLSTIKHADKIIVINKGQIVEEGSHSDLLKSKGIYSQLWNVQAGIREIKQ